MNVLRSISIAFSTYSVLPAPRCQWTEQNMRWAICALPLVGVVSGGLLLLWQALCLYLGLRPALFAGVAAVIPLAVSGGIHMDGFCDTVDALASHQPRERKLEILKDSHVGAFAVIFCPAYLLLTYVLYGELYGSRALWVAGAGMVLARALTACTAVSMNSARASGMLVSFARPAHRAAALVVSGLTAGLTAAAMLAWDWNAGLCAVMLCLIVLLAYGRMAMREFGGITGDTSGFFLQICELAVLMGALIGDIWEGLA